MRYVLLLSVLCLAGSVRGQVLSVPASANEGDGVTITYDEAPDALIRPDQVTIDFGDGTSLTTNAPGRSAHLVFQHYYVDDSHATNYTVTVTEEDFEFNSVETTKQIRVLNVPPTVNMLSEFTVTAGRLLGFFGINDPSFIDRFTVDISYGDGSVKTIETGQYIPISLDHTYNVTGTYTLTVQVRDDEGGLWSGTARVVVTGTVPAPRLTVYSFAGVVLTGELGRSYDIQKTDSAESTNWTTVATVTLATNPQLWMDMNSTNSSKRFYRAMAR